MHVLRAERGFIIVGQETDGTVTPHDLGLESMIGAAKRDFVGKRSLARPDLRAPNRKQLVGLLTEDPRLVLEEGAQLVADPREPHPDDRARPRHVELRQRELRPLDRHGAGRRRPRAPGRNRFTRPRQAASLRPRLPHSHFLNG